MPVLDAAHCADARIVGHKFARQAALRQAGFPVPRFVCVPAEVFDAVAGPVLERLPRPGSEAEELSAWAERVRTAIRARPLPETLVGELVAAFDDLVGSEGHVAVRACVVPGGAGEGGEDGASDPMAGLSDSYLYVPRTDLARRVSWCLASAFNPEAVLYRTRSGRDPGAARVAVGVQAMVFAARSFVAFTRDPRDGADRTVIAAAHGIGEGVVQEKADIDHFFVDGVGEGEGEESRAVECRPTTKRRMLGWDPQRPHSGVVELPVPAALADRPVLDDDEARAVHALASRVRAHFGGPQDIEGAITPDGAIHLLQARPVAPGPAAARARIPWTNHNLTESYPGITSTLTYSLARGFYEDIFGDFYRRMGVSAAVLRDERHHLRHMIGMLGGRVYYRLDAWYTLHGMLPAFEVVRPTWETGLGIPARHRLAAEPRPGLRRRLVRSAPRLAGVMLRHPGTVRAFLRWWDAVAAENDALEARGADDPDELPISELIARYHAVWAQVAVHWGVTLVAGYLVLLHLLVFNRLRDRWAPGLEQGTVTGLLCGGPENRSVAALRSTIALAERARAEPRLAEALRGAAPDAPDDRRIWAGIIEGEYGRDLARAAAEHVRRYGDRAVQDLKLETATPRQQPWLILAAVRAYAEQRLTVAASRADERRTLEQAERGLAAACPSRWRRLLLRALITRVRRGLKVREDTRFCRSQLYGYSRRVLLRLGDELARADRLDQAGDVIDLTVDEVVGAFDGTLAGLDLRGLVRHRRAERLAAADLSAPPAWLTTRADVPVAVEAARRAVSEAVSEAGSEPASAAEPRSGAPGALAGLASSGGRARGRAAVVLDPATAPRDWRGGVLIARETDPGWLFLMLGAKAIVVERGSLLSHTAITGRLLGIPTVVAVEGATALIPDGATVEVDGDAGTVRIVEEVAER